MKLFEQKEDNTASYVVCKTLRRSSYRRWLKISKRRYERHRAKRNPETVPLYGKYDGYEY